MQAAELRHDLFAGAEVQVVRVAEDDRRAKRAELLRIDELHRRLRSHGYEGRRRHFAVLRAQDACSRGAVTDGHREVTGGHRISIASPNE